MKHILSNFKSIFSGGSKEAVAADAPRFEAGRFKFIRTVLLGSFIIISIRASIIQLFPPSEAQLKRIANKQYEQQLDIAPYRGLILDRNGHPFAISIKRPSLAVNPRVFDPSAGDLKKLSTLLDMPKSRIKEVGAKNAYFSWLKRRVDATTAAAIESLEINGLYFINEPARIYPQQHVAAHLIGSVGSDNDGLLGIEHQFDKILRGEKVTVSPSKDARGRTILFSSDLAAPDLPGHTLQLTIDHVIQEITDDALREGVLKAKAKSGFALVTDPHTGRILALSNYPTFDPNAIGKINIENTRNHAVLDSFEPGSVTKPLVVAAAIQNDKTYPDELHNCENGLYRVGGVAFKDDHPAAMLSTTETIVRSSNVCTYKIAERLGKEGLYNAYRNFGLGGQLTLPELFPVISIGSISNPSSWKPIRFANIAFGQGLTTTGLEMAMAYGALANGGSLMKPQLIDRMISPSGEISYAAAPEAIRTPISSETALKMRKILAKVVTSKEGTGKTAATDWYTTAGKTGTAEKVDPTTKAYSADKRIASFIGFAPAQDPYLVIYVAIDEPGLKPYYGSLWAGPVFATIAEKSLRYLNVAPDKQPPLAVLKQNLLAPSAAEQGDSRAKSKL